MLFRRPKKVQMPSEIAGQSVIGEGVGREDFCLHNRKTPAFFTFSIFHIMYIKKFFFALPVALLAVFFTFCTKESDVAFKPLNPATNATVGDRTTCGITVRVTSQGSVDLCGVQTSLVSCGLIGATQLLGIDQLNGLGATGNYVLNFSNGVVGTFFQVSNLQTATPVDVDIISSSGSTLNLTLGGGNPATRTVTVDNFCGLH